MAAFRAALEESDARSTAAPAGPVTQGNLGNALLEAGLSERAGPRVCTEAVAAYRAALEVKTRERVPLDWAKTQNNLGRRALELGQRESGTAHLEEAVAAFQAALEESTRDRVPLQWAMTQENLGAALGGLANARAGRRVCRRRWQRIGRHWKKGRVNACHSNGR